MLTFVLLVGQARAACLGADADADGVHAGSFTQCDCDDTDATRYPNSQEVVGNNIDEDCDGNDRFVRKILERSFPSASWTYTGSVTTVTEGVTVGNGILSSGSIARSFSLPMWYGVVHAVVNVTANSGNPFAKCYLDVSTLGQFGVGTLVTDTWQITGNGTGSLPTGALAVTPAPRTLKEVVVRCEAGASVTLDWLSVQNTADILGPAENVSVVWDDVDIPGGGLTTTVVRASSSGELYAAADLGGVGYKDPMDSADTPWATINGDMVNGALTDQSSINVWDVLPADWGDVFALTGRRVDTTLAGGFYVYDVGTGGWSLLADTDSDEVGGYGRYSGCGSSIKPYGGGKLLVQEPGIEGVYIANGDENNLGVAFYDGTQVCELPTVTPLPAGYVGALARVQTDPTDLPALLVGYRGMGNSAQSLYLCELPIDGNGDPKFDCGDTQVIDCAPVTDAVGLDIRDIEVDPLLPNVVYIADGGHDPAASPSSNCQIGDGGLYQFDVTDDTSGNLDGALLTDLSSGLVFSADLEITGVSLDPDGDFIFAFLPANQDAGYDEDRIYRMPYADIGTGTWAPINEDLDRNDRDAHLVLSGAWLEANTSVKAAPPPYRAHYAPGHAIDAVWFQGWDSPTWDNCRGDAWYAAISTDVNAWRVAGLDDPDDLYCDTTTEWDPEGNTEWVFWPEPDTSRADTWQTTVINDIAEDQGGNIFMPASDHGLFMLPKAGGPAELDCLWDFFNAGGSAVSVGEDGSVWVGLYDQGVSSSSAPQETGIFRTLDGGGSWEYQGAGVTNTNAYGEDNFVYNEYPYCKDQDTAHEAVPFGDVGSQDDGNVFNGGAESITASSTSSWGNVTHLAAVNTLAAVAAFQSYTTTSAVDGKLAYTLDGGITWTDVTFDGDWAGDGATIDDCGAYEVYEKVKGVAIIHRGVDSFAEDTDSDNIADNWQLDFFVASRNNTATNGNCALARVTVKAASTTWTWFPLDRASGAIDCEVDEANMRGVDTLPWSDEVVVWGFYDYTGGTHAGGACVIDINDPATVTELVDPAVHQYNIADISPAPYVNDLLVVAPYIDASAWIECHESGAGDCPDKPYPMFAERDGATWTLTDFPAVPPSLVATAVNWTDFNDPAILYATEGAGAWKGTLTW